MKQKERGRPIIPATLEAERRGSEGRPAWAAKGVQGQPGKLRESLSLKLKTDLGI